MRVLKAIGRWLWRFMIIFSFIVNLVLVVILIGAGLLIFEIKNSIAQPLIGGLHSTAVGLENATIDWTIPVRDTIPVNLNVKLDTNTVVVLTAPVPLQVTAKIDLPGINAYGVDANVNLTLPAGLQLPVALNLDVPVNEPALPVSLDVRAVIPLKNTQLADPIQNLGLLFEPLALGLYNLPSNFDEAGQLVSNILSGNVKLNETNLLRGDGQAYGPNFVIRDEPYNPWAGYSLTAGLGYTLIGEQVPPENVAQPTGLVPLGGIPFLDALLVGRADLYVNGSTPATVNEQALNNLNSNGVNPVYFSGTMADYYNSLHGGGSVAPTPIDPNQTTSGGTGIDPNAQATPTPDFGVGGVAPTPTVPSDFGIVIPPGN